MHQVLEVLGAAITARLQHLQDYGLFDSETQATAADLHVRDVSIASQIEAVKTGEDSPEQRSLIAREIDALGERFRLWLARIDRRYQNVNMPDELGRHRG
jgi:hypothetical protein